MVLFQAYYPKRAVDWRFCRPDRGLDRGGYNRYILAVVRDDWRRNKYGCVLACKYSLSGYQKEWSPYSIPGQRIKYETERLPEKEKGWYLIPGKVDNASYYLLGFFVLTLVFLLAVQHWI